MIERPGLVVLFGSGETSPSGRKVHDWLFSQLESPVAVTVLETPAGFEPNSERVAGRVAEFFREKLQNYQPRVTVVPARQRGTAFSPDNPSILAPLLSAGVIFLGPGSPTYTIRQLKDSLAWDYLVSRYRLGASLVLASAAAIAASAYALPVYEIYKVGEDLHWRRGLDLFGAYGLSLVFVPHWDNAEGGAELDTSRCYMSQERFDRLLKLLTGDLTVVGIDEHTALAIDVEAEECRVLGRGGVTVLARGQQHRFPGGQSFAIKLLGPFRRPTGVDPRVERVRQAAEAETATVTQPTPPPVVLTLAEERETARARRDWPTADALRERIAALGWQIADSPQGPLLSPLPTTSQP